MKDIIDKALKDALPGMLTLSFILAFEPVFKLATYQSVPITIEPPAEPLFAPHFIRLETHPCSICNELHLKIMSEGKKYCSAKCLVEDLSKEYGDDFGW